MVNPQDKRLKINVKLFREIQRMITEYPQAFDMGSYNGKWAFGGDVMKFDPKTMEKPDCGSACCIAGWAVTLGDNTSLEKTYLSNEEIHERAAGLLGLTENQADDVFLYKGDNTLLALVSVEDACAMIDRFLADPSKPIR